MELKEKSTVGWNGGFWVVKKIHNAQNVEIWRDGKIAVVNSDSLWVVEELKVKKKSGKPFKSGNVVNTVKETILHPVLKNQMAYTFHEDDSFVSVEMCEKEE